MDRHRHESADADLAVTGPPPSKPQSPSIREQGIVVAKGAAMGTADLVPGISGGTMALILGIHPRLVSAIAAVDVRLPGDLWRATRGDADARVALRRLDLRFLVPLAIGIVGAVFIGAAGIHYALVERPRLAMAFFSGLLVASLPVPWSHVSGDARREAGWGFVAGAIVAGAIVFLPSSSWPLHPLGLAAAGAIGFTAMLLPGISGSGLLLLLGVYDPILAAAAERDFLVLVPVALGGGLGLAAASRALKWLFARHGDVTYGFLTGLLAGSVLRVWPWRDAPGFAEGWPTFASGPLESGLLVGAYGLAGFLLVRVLDRWVHNPESV